MHRKGFLRKRRNTERQIGSMTKIEKTAKDFAAGVCTATTTTLVGHPFDTIKVRMQTSNQFSSLLHCLRHTLRSEGALGLYKGMPPMLVGQQIVTTFSFSMYQYLRRMLNPSFLYVGATTPTTASEFHKQIRDIVLAGMGTGFCNSLVMTPVDRVKVRLQVQYMSLPGTTVPHEMLANPPYRSTIDCIRRLVASHGIKYGLFRGWQVTCLRELFGCTTWYGTYEISRYMLQRPDGTIGVPQLALAGVVSGVIAWSVIFPIDTIKSRIQMQTSTSHTAKSSLEVLHTFATVIKEEGMRALFKGYSACVIRAVPVAATIFSTYEFVRRILN